MGYIEELRQLIGHRPLILPGSAVIVENAEGKILLQQRTYPLGKWALPGGLMELAESGKDCARRELLEETSLKLGELSLIDVYSDEEYLCSAANGDQWYVVTICYHCKDWTGEVQVNDHESLQFAWFDPKELPNFFAATHRYMIADYLKKKA